MQPDPAPVYSFRTLESADLKLVRAWLEQSHWREIFGDPAIAQARIAAGLDDIAVETLIGELDDEAFVLLRCIDPHLTDDHLHADQPSGAICLELAIGPAQHVGKGHGPAVLRGIADLLFEEGAPRLIFDPQKTNSHAISAGQKAGFAIVGERPDQKDTLLVMALDNPDMPDLTDLQEGQSYQ